MPKEDKEGNPEKSKVLTFPKSELMFNLSPHDGAEEISRIVLINPGSKNVAYKFLTNAESQGMRVNVSPPKGVIGAEENEEVSFTLRGAPPEEDLSALKVVVETWNEGKRRGGKSRMRIPCFRFLSKAQRESRTSLVQQPQPPTAMPQENLAPKEPPEVDAKTAAIPNYPPPLQHNLPLNYIPFASSSSQSPLSSPTSGSRGMPSSSQRLLESGDSSRDNLQSSRLYSPLSTVGMRQNPLEDMPRDLPPRSLEVRRMPESPVSSTVKPTFFIDTVPFTGEVNSSDHWLDNVDLLPYLGSMLVWVGVGVFVGKGYFCPCR